MKKMLRSGKNPATDQSNLIFAWRRSHAASSLFQFCLLIAFLGLAQNGLSQIVIGGWDMSTLPGGTNNFGPSPYAATETAANVTVGGLTRGAGISTSGTGAARGWGGTSWGTSFNNADSSVLFNDFFTFTVKANAGFALSLSSIGPFDYRRSSTGPLFAEIQYQINGGAYSLITTVSFPSTSSGGASVGSTDLSGISALQNLPSSSTVTFRIVPFRASSTTGTFYIFDTGNSTANDFAVNGTLCALPACSIIGADFVCNNSPGNIYTAPAGMASYNWSISGNGSIPGATNGQSVSVTSGNFLGSYTVFVTITNANGCTSTCSKQSDIFLFTPPADITVSPGTTLCLGTTLDLSIAAAASSTVAWSGEGVADPDGTFVPDGFGGFYNQTTAIPTTTGPHTYSVTVMADPLSGGCSNTGEVSVTVQSCNIDFSGKIIFSNNNSFGVKDANVVLTGSANGNNLTDSNGDFFISTAVGSGSFTLKPAKTVNKLNGLTAADATAIQQHVANSVPITDPYKLVAADVNKSNSITTVDASVITQSLLGNPAALAQFKTSWRFAPTSHTMSIPPWGFPEQRTYTNITSGQTNQDFYGIKTGDVVTTFANPASFGAGNPLVLNVQDQVLHTGATVTAAFKASQLSDLAAFQFALKFDAEKLELAEITPLEGLPLKADNFGAYNNSDGEIRSVWSQAEGVFLEEAAPVFSLKFNVLQSGGKLSEVLQLNEDVLPGLAYNSALAESKIELVFSGLTGTGNPAGVAGVQLLQNRPNPFNGTTAIGFALPESCEAQLRIFDVSGKILAERKAQYPAGRSEEAFELGVVSGVLWYELVTPFGTLARKMVALK